MNSDSLGSAERKMAFAVPSGRASRLYVSLGQG